MRKLRTGRAAFYLMLAGVAGLCAVGPFRIAPAMAQDQKVEDRLERVERDLNQLQRQVYRNEVGGGPAPVAPAPSAGGGTGALDVQIRMDQIEQQMRNLTGKLEENQYNISQLQNRLDKMQSDNESRFQALETGGGGNGGGGAPPPPADAHRPRRGAAAGAGNMDQPASASGTLVAPDDSAGATEPVDPAPTPAAAPAGASVLPSGSTQDQYNYAFGLLRSADYKGAETAFKAFLQKHSGDPLAANAQYWLGETFFVRGDFGGAAAAFADGYQKYPQGPKAADNLLKLGMSLGNEGKKQDACFSFARLERDFPNLAPALKERAASEKKHFGC